MGNTGGDEARTIKTAQFGDIVVEKQYIFTFNNGLLGFEDLREFVLISEEETEPFKWLISVETPDIGFPLLSPWHIDMEYEPGRDYNFEQYVVFVIITLEDEQGKMTANMKAPVVLDVEGQSGEQIILPRDKYLPDFVIPIREAEKTGMS